MPQQMVLIPLLPASLNRCFRVSKETFGLSEYCALLQKSIFSASENKASLCKVIFIFGRKQLRYKVIFHSVQNLDSPIHLHKSIGLKKENFPLSIYL